MIKAVYRVDNLPVDPIIQFGKTIKLSLVLVETNFW